MPELILCSYPNKAYISLKSLNTKGTEGLLQEYGTMMPQLIKIRV